jgi:hypothetical protein
MYGGGAQPNAQYAQAGPAAQQPQLPQQQQVAQVTAQVAQAGGMTPQQLNEARRTLNNPHVPESVKSSLLQYIQKRFAPPTWKYENVPGYGLVATTDRGDVRDVRRLPRKLEATEGPVDPATGEKQRGYFNSETGQFVPFAAPQNSGQPSNAFRGNSAEIQGVNELIRAGTITKEQGADFLAGKTVTGPDGAQYFLTPKGIIQRAPQNAPPPPGTLSAAPSGAAQPGVIPLTGGRTSEGQKIAEKATAEAKIALPGVLNNSIHALKTIEDTRTHPGRKSWGATGWSAGIPLISEGIPGTEGRGFVGLVNQMKGKAFLEAFDKLRGGGQITVVEGDKATAAIARLDRAQNDKDFEAALDDLADIIKVGRRKAYRDAGVPDMQVEALERAHAAVMKGADRAAVRKRLEENGIPPYGF